MLQNGEELNLQLNSYIKNIPSKEKSSFQYEFFDKVCFSSSSLKRHGRGKHPPSKAQETLF